MAKNPGGLPRSRPHTLTDPPTDTPNLLDSSSMFGIGPMELVLILVVALLVLGPKRMPELARTIGRGLGEFRRASNELRQSLALDDLQNDLRQGLAGTNTIKKPDQDRPAQAGDDLAPATDDAKATGSQDDPAEASGETNAADAGDSPDNTPGQTPDNTPENDPAVTRTQPGELPPDHDPHAHHDVEEEPATRATATPADSQLGNIPVGGAPAGDPTPTATPTPAAPPASATPSRSPGRTDDERG